MSRASIGFAETAFGWSFVCDGCSVTRAALLTVILRLPKDEKCFTIKKVRCPVTLVTLVTQFGVIAHARACGDG